ncbi:hypothetical protein EZV73_06145 [Acidaminobacter sp. JC074]|uniref:hypothetical protein n=1 Tax=Acidaminobacter sp. JC074 TaxID=2530199 RepID=UPI001F0DE8FF|nr:hypothetical protein [Acidaminobacter sp. JC074]MCH4887141.1 hypothetical protein [Acidaminobacter sp. JC074]
MEKLKKVYLFIGTAIVAIALIDLFFITRFRYNVVLNVDFFIRVTLMTFIFIFGIRLIRKIDRIFVDRILELNVLRAKQAVMDDYRDVSIEKHEITRKLQIIQSYAKMKNYDELEAYLQSELEKE